MTATRRLAVIVVADVVGCSRLMEQDEAGMLAALELRGKLAEVLTLIGRNGHLQNRT